MTYQPEIWKWPDYRQFLRNYIASHPKKGRGASSLISTAIGIHSSLFSQILSGRRNFTPEQASLFCDYAELSDIESTYFLKLVEVERAGNQSLKTRLQKEIHELRGHFLEVKAHVQPPTKSLSEHEKSVFYSSWHYSAVRMLCGLEKPITLEEIARTTRLSKKRISEVVKFLLQTGLIVEVNAKLELGPNATHIEAESPWSTRHHINWRVKSFEKIERLQKDELCFTAPFSCSNADHEKIREELLKCIKEISKRVSNSGPQRAGVLCIDLLNIND